MKNLDGEKEPLLAILAMIGGIVGTIVGLFFIFWGRFILGVTIFGFGLIEVAAALKFKGNSN